MTKLNTLCSPSDQDPLIISPFLMLPLRNREQAKRDVAYIRARFDPQPAEL